MADVVVTGLSRAQVIFHHPSGEAKDRFVNTWHFQRTSGDFESTSISIGLRLYDFYTKPAGISGGISIASRLASAKIESMEIRVYDIAQPPPRLPFIINVDPKPTFGTSGAPLPEEVAICLSYVAGVGPRRRGRLYLGPWTSEVMLQTGPRTRVALNVRNSIMALAEELMGFTGDVRWTLLSRADVTYATVLGGWVDDAFDTQRRRGLAPTDRGSFGEPPSAGGVTIPIAP